MFNPQNNDIIFCEEESYRDELSRKDNENIKKSSNPITQKIINQHKSRSTSYNPTLPKNFVPHLVPSKGGICPSPLVLNQESHNQLIGNPSSFELASIPENEEFLFKRSKSTCLTSFSPNFEEKDNTIIDNNSKKISSMLDKDTEINLKIKSNLITGIIFKTLEYNSKAFIDSSQCQ